MGALALIAALHFGRSILLPVVAALIVGMTLSAGREVRHAPAVPQPVSAIVLVLLLTALIGLVLTLLRRAADRMDRARAGDRRGRAGKAAGARLSALGLSRDRKAHHAGCRAGPTVSVESNPAEMVGAALLAITPAVSQFVVFFGTLIFFLATSNSLRQQADRRVRDARRAAAHAAHLERHRAESRQLCRDRDADQSRARRGHDRDALRWSAFPIR